MILRLILALCVLTTSAAQVVRGPVFPTTPSGSPSTLNDGLIAYWKMDEASGNALDAEPTGTAQELTDVNTVTSDTGKISTARHFLATASERFTRTDSADLSLGADQDFTLSVWVYLDSKPAGVMGLIDKSDSTNNGTEYRIRFETTADVFVFRIGTGAGTATVSASTFGSPSLATWYHVMAWHDSTANQIGISVNNGTANTAGHTGGTQDAANTLSVGSQQAAGYLNGMLDEIAFYKRILTSDEKIELHNAGAGKTCCAF